MKALWYFAAGDQVLQALVTAFAFVCWTDTYNWGSTAFMSVMIAATILEFILTVIGFTYPMWWPNADKSENGRVINWGGHHFLLFWGYAILLIASAMWQGFFHSSLGGFPGFTGNEVQFIYFREANLLQNAFYLVGLLSFIMLTPVYKTDSGIRALKSRMSKVENKMNGSDGGQSEVEMVSPSGKSKSSRVRKLP